MVNTIVCKEEGCSGNRFKVSVQRLKFILICTECRKFQKYNKEMNINIPTICTECTGEIFKVCKDVEYNRLIFECTCCGNNFTVVPRDEIKID